VSLEEIMRAQLLALAVVSLLYPLAASADVIPPDVYACSNKKKGDACTLTTPAGQGTCQDGQYCHLVYGKCDASGGPCGSTCDYALACKSGTAPATDASTPTADGGGKTTTKESGCTIGGIDARLFGPWVLAGSVSVLLLLVRRRRR
jgi:hypothetical protein